MDLQHYSNNGIELYINNQTGETLTTAKGYSKMSNIPYSTIKDRIQRILSKGDASTLIKDIEIQTVQGIQRGRGLTEQLICEWLPKDNPEITTKLMQLGVRVFLHQLAGYKVSSTALNQSQNSEKIFAKEFLESMWSDISNRYPEIDKRLIDGAKLNGYARHYPELAGEIAEAKHLISATSTETKLPMSPTELGQYFAKENGLTKVSAQKINAALILDGFQVKSDQKLCPYELTKKGQEYGKLQLETCYGKDKTVYRIRWQTDILKLIKSTLISLIK